jgi:hypothetical protein
MVGSSSPQSSSPAQLQALAAGKKGSVVVFGRTLSNPESKQSGQTLVEFALVIPFLVVLFMALLEMALALNASVAVTRASQHGAHIAASAGNTLGADCLILASVEGDLGIPNDARKISEVVIERTSGAGEFALAWQTWRRIGSTDCQLPDGSPVKVPYSLTFSSYPEDQRCSVLGGCPTMLPVNTRTTVDNIGVTVRYRHDWVTPLNGALDFVGTIGGTGAGSSPGGWSFEQRNIFRIEPVL